MERLSDLIDFSSWSKRQLVDLLDSYYVLLQAKPETVKNNPDPVLPYMPSYPYPLADPNVVRPTIICGGNTCSVSNKTQETQTQ